MRKSIPVMAFQGKGRQMDNTDSTDSAKDWRQAWRAFADTVSGRFSDSHNGATPTSRPRPQDFPEGPFHGFDSPPGKF